MICVRIDDCDWSATEGLVRGDMYAMLCKEMQNFQLR
jgi:hypothetical protein